MGKEEIKIRKKFPGDFDPSTKVHKIKTDYTRKENKDVIKDALNQMEEDEGEIDFEY